MAKSLIDIEKKVEKAMKKALKKTAEEVSDEIQSLYEIAIDEFYDSYTPSVDRRTGGLYKASSNYGYGNYGDSNNVTVGEDFAIGGISVNSGFYEGNYGVTKPADTDWVFQRAFINGIHGYTKKESKEWTERAKKRAEKNGTSIYRVFHYRSGMVTKKKPVSELNKKVNKKFKKGNYISELFTKNLLANM